MSNAFFPSRPESRPTIYAYEDTHPRYADLLTERGKPTLDFTMRPGQKAAVKKTIAYFAGRRKALVLTFKPAVQSD